MSRSLTKKLALASALGASFACAGTDERPHSAQPPPDPNVTLPLDAGDEDARAPEAGRMPRSCSEGGFCYVSVPAVGPLRAVSASSVDDAWMVSAQSGAILRWNGTSLKRVYAYEGASPSSIVFFGIWAETKDNVWATAIGSDGRILLVRYATSASGGPPAFRELRTQEPAATLSSVWGTPSGDALWIVTDRAVLRVREDTNGPVVDELDPAIDTGDAKHSWRGVWGFGPDDVYVAGKVCSSSLCDSTDGHGALWHWNGTGWSALTLDGGSDVASLRGTPPGIDRQLWYDTNEPSSAMGSKKLVLVPITEEGKLGATLYEHASELAPACSGRIGHAATPTSGWFSSGLLLCRWTGTKLEPAPTSRGGIPAVESLNGIWAGGTDDAWIVGAALPQDGLPPAGFAARRTATSAAGGRP